MGQDETLQAFFDNHIVGMVEVNVSGQYTWVNNQWTKMIGYTVDEILATDFQTVTHPEDIPRQLVLDEKLAEKEISSYQIKKRYRHKDGHFFWGHLSVTGIYDEENTLVGMVGLIIDITENKQYESDLSDNATRFRSLIDNMEHIPVQGYDKERRVVYWNTASTELYGYSEEEALGEQLENLVLPPALKEEFITAVQRWVNSGIKIPAGKLMLRNKAGEDVTVYSSHLMHVNQQGEKELYCIDIDLRLLEQAEGQVRKLAAAVEQSGETIVITDTAGTIEYVNPAFTTVTGYSREEALGQNPRILNAGQQDEAVYAELWATITSGEIWSGRFINKKKDGSLFTEDVSIFPIFDPTGEITNFVAIKRDITEQLLTEEKYHHAQKMEMIGQLAGGIAHDFNNMLAIIFGQVEIALLKTAAEDPLRKRLEEIKAAATRSAQLTRQLLGFARKQTRQAKPMDINDAVASTLTMLKNLIGENIELHWNPKAKRPIINMDPNHFNQIVTNLIINARDAIAGTGAIAVKTTEEYLDQEFCNTHRGSKTGHYICLTVTDNGCGMNAETSEKIFEPFFTTKEVGKGTGLGLSMVFGLIKQNDGYIVVDSHIGKGSTFKLYFPQVYRRDRARATQAADETLVTGNETILVVEDEGALLDVVTGILSEAGYNILSAQGPFAAIQLAEKHKGEIHLLLTDIIMPKMNGVELSEHLREIKDDIKVLYMSGYPRGHFSHQKHLDPSALLLKKPFSAHKLTRMVRDVLDA